MTIVETVDDLHMQAKRGAGGVAPGIFGGA